MITSSSRRTCGSTAWRPRTGIVLRTWRPSTDSKYWIYDGKRFPTVGLSAVVGKTKEEFSPEPLNYSEMRPGCYDPKARLEDMDRSGVLASLCFPTITRFCGQLFMDASDREFGFQCLQHYNDWLVEEWCGAAPGRYIPLMLIPMWDPPLAAKEMERMAAKGVTAFAFSENPEPLGLPTIHDANQLLGPRDGGGKRAGDGGLHARRLVVHPAADCQGRPVHGQPHLGRLADVGDHVGLVVQRPLPTVPESEDRPFGGRSRLDPLLPRAGRAGPRQAAVLGPARPEIRRPRRRRDVDLDQLDIRGSFRDHVFGCFIEDYHGVASIHEIGEDNVMCETDYPHSDSTWPDCIGTAKRVIKDLPPELQYKLLRGNAERLYRFTPAEPPTVRPIGA